MIGEEESHMCVYYVEAGDNSIVDSINRSPKLFKMPTAVTISASLSHSKKV